MERCVSHVMSQGHDKVSAIKICKSSIFSKSNLEDIYKPTPGMQTLAKSVVEIDNPLLSVYSNKVKGREFLSNYELRFLNTFLEEHSKLKTSKTFYDEHSRDKVLWDALGGDVAYRWTKRKVKELDAREANLDTWPPELAERFKEEMRIALDSFDLDRVQELRRIMDRVEQQGFQQTAPQPPQEDYIAKTSDVVYDYNPLHTPEHIPQPPPQPNEAEVRDPGVVKCACGGIIGPGEEYCPSCGMHKGVAEQNPLEWPIAKVAQLPDEPQASQPQMGQDVPMPQAPNPANMQDQAPPDKINELQNPVFMARQQIADDSAAQFFSRIENLDNADQILQALSQSYQQDPEQLKGRLAIQAKFGDAIAINGDIIKGDIDRSVFEEVNPDAGEKPGNPLLPPTAAGPGDELGQPPQAPGQAPGGLPGGPQQPPQGMSPIPPPAPESEENQFTKIEKGAKVPIKLILQKIMKENNVDENTANTMLEDQWGGGAEMPLSFDVPVSGELKFFLPKEDVGVDQTENPFQTDQRPEDVMDQEYNQVPMQPAH